MIEDNDPSMPLRNKCDNYIKLLYHIMNLI